MVIIVYLTLITFILLNENLATYYYKNRNGVYDIYYGTVANYGYKEFKPPKLMKMDFDKRGDRPGKCQNGNFTCREPYAIKQTEIFECEIDYQCPRFFKCCQPNCFQHKVCQPARFDEDYPEITTRPSPMTKLSSSTMFTTNSTVSSTVITTSTVASRVTTQATTSPVRTSAIEYLTTTVGTTQFVSTIEPTVSTTSFQSISTVKSSSAATEVVSTVGTSSRSTARKFSNFTESSIISTNQPATSTKKFSNFTNASTISTNKLPITTTEVTPAVIGSTSGNTKFSTESSTSTIMSSTVSTSEVPTTLLSQNSTTYTTQASLPTTKKSLTISTSKFPSTISSTLPQITDDKNMTFSGEYEFTTSGVSTIFEVETTRNTSHSSLSTTGSIKPTITLLTETPFEVPSNSMEDTKRTMVVTTDMTTIMMAQTLSPTENRFETKTPAEVTRNTASALLLENATGTVEVTSDDEDLTFSGDHELDITKYVRPTTKLTTRASSETILPYNPSPSITSTSSTGVAKLSSTTASPPTRNTERMTILSSEKTVFTGVTTDQSSITKLSSTTSPKPIIDMKNTTVLRTEKTLGTTEKPKGVTSPESISISITSTLSSKGGTRTITDTGDDEDLTFSGDYESDTTTATKQITESLKSATRNTGSYNKNNILNTTTGVTTKMNRLSTVSNTIDLTTDMANKEEIYEGSTSNEEISYSGDGVNADDEDFFIVDRTTEFFRELKDLEYTTKLSMSKSNTETGETSVTSYLAKLPIETTHYMRTRKDHSLFTKFISGATLASDNKETNIVGENNATPTVQQNSVTNGNALLTTTLLPKAVTVNTKVVDIEPSAPSTVNPDSSDSMSYVNDMVIANTVLDLVMKVPNKIEEGGSDKNDLYEKLVDFEDVPLKIDEVRNGEINYLIADGKRINTDYETRKIDEDNRDKGSFRDMSNTILAVNDQGIDRVNDEPVKLDENVYTGMGKLSTSATLKQLLNEIISKDKLKTVKLNYDVTESDKISHHTVTLEDQKLHGINGPVLTII